MSLQDVAASSSGQGLPGGGGVPTPAATRGSLALVTYNVGNTQFMSTHQTKKAKIFKEKLNADLNTFKKHPQESGTDFTNLFARVFHKI